jgi:2-oxoglutarate dehydrogenase E2 component (dihydrolipoamide succinyltransferase)
MLTTYNEVDMTAVMALRREYKDLFEKKHGVKLGFMSFFTKACCHALKEVPEVNAEIDGDRHRLQELRPYGRRRGHAPGLVVPVVRDADQMSFAAIEKRSPNWAARARRQKQHGRDAGRHLHDLQRRGLRLADVLADPEPAAIGHPGHAQDPGPPDGGGGEIVIRPMMYLALSYDHRIVDGKGAVTFLVRVKEALEDPRRLLMDL